MGLLIPETGLLFWMLIPFGILLFVLARWGFPVILRAVEGRKDRIAASLQGAADAERRAAELHARADGILAQAQKQGGELIEQARKQGVSIIEQSRRVSREQASRSAEQAASEAEEIKRRALDEAMGHIAALSVKIAGKVLEEDLKGGQKQEKLIERLLDEETAVPTANF